MRELIRNQIHFDEQRKIWVLDGSGGIPYSDGIEAERYILGCIQGAKDLSTTSEELSGMIRDWPTQYHLSLERSQLLRGFQIDPDATALEIGCGCGAITRFLGENLAQVHAVEGSLNRAQIAGARCRDLSNVDVIAAPFHKLKPKRKYDLVVCIGVLEYSRSFVKEADPVAWCLEFMRGLVAPGGALVLGIENQFGLKYFSGCTEDHTNIHFDGIEGYPAAGDTGPVTFGKQELQDRLEAAGFPNTRFYMAFPDYKLPQCLIDDRVAIHAPVNLGGIVRRIPARDYSQRPLNLFCDTLAWWEIGKNRNLSTFSPSFLVMAHPNADQSPISADWDGMLFATARDRMYRTKTAFYDMDTGAGRVCKSPVYPGSPIDNDLKIHWEETPFEEGTPFDVLLLKAAKNRRNPFELFDEYLKTWAVSLNRFKTGHRPTDRSLPEPECPLSGRSLDATPWNLCASGEGERYFDLEWEWPSDLPVMYVIARGFLGLMVGNAPHLKALVDPARPTLEQWMDDCFARLWPDRTVAWREPFLSLESELMAKVNGSDAAGVKASYVRLLSQPLVESRGAALAPTQRKDSALTSIIILTYNQLEYTRGCLSSIVEHTPQNHHVILVDNGSTDGTVEFLKTFEETHPNISVILNRENRGFAAGNNQGIERATGDFILLLNNDVVVTEGWLERMLACMHRNPDVGIVGPTSNFVSGPQLVPNATYGEDLEKMKDLAAAIGRDNNEKTSPVLRLVGFCLLIRKEVLELTGGLDENFGSGNYEDDDLCLRSHIAGSQHVIAHDVFVHHFGSVSFSGNAISYNDSMENNRILFERKWKHLIAFSGNAYQLRMDRISQVRELVKWGEKARTQGQDGRAVRLFNKALTMNPHDPDALRNLEIAGKVRSAEAGVEGHKVGDRGSESGTATLAPDVSKPEMVTVVLVRDGKGPVQSSAEEMEKACRQGCEVVSFDLSSAGPGLMSFLNERWNSFAGTIVAVVLEGVVLTDGALDKMLAVMTADESVALVVPSSNVGTGAQSVKATYKSLKKELQRFSRKIAHHRKGQVAEVDMPETQCVLIRRAPVRFPGGFRTEAGLMALSHDLRKSGSRVVCCCDSYVHVEPVVLEDGERQREGRAVRCLQAAEEADVSGDGDGAVTSAREAVDAVPGWARAHNNLGRYLHGKGDRSGARSAIEKTLMLDPGCAEAHSNLGVLQWESEELEAAVASFGRAAKLEPENVDVLYNVGSIYAQSGDPEHATIFFERCLALKPDDPDIQAQINGLKKGHKIAK